MTAHRAMMIVMIKTTTLMVIMMPITVMSMIITMIMTGQSQSSSL